MPKLDPKFILLYPPQHFDPKFGAVKPDGSLGLLYLASALRNAHFHVQLLDLSVGDSLSGLEETFYTHKKLPNGKYRVGMSSEQIVDAVSEYDVVGISSIFTAQTRSVEETTLAIRSAYPKKLIIMGGVNARSQAKRFLDIGVDLICSSEAEQTIVEIGQVVRANSRNFSQIPGVIFKNGEKVIFTPSPNALTDLDQLPFPAWDLLPLDLYWRIARPHGGGFSEGEHIKYSSMMTSRGCPFSCHYCHISIEKETDSTTGNIGKFRTKSIERVLKEIDVLKDLGVEYVFLEDDSLLAKTKRAIEIFRRISERGLQLADVNGINLVHLHKRERGKLVVNEELLEAMAAAGFKKLIFPVESGSQDVIDTYASGKLNLAVHDIEGLIRCAKSHGIEIGGNYLFGWPGENSHNMQQTYQLALQHMKAGMDYVNFHLIAPFPGSKLYDYAKASGILFPDLDPADINWDQPSMQLPVSAEQLQDMIVNKWESANNQERVKRLRGMIPTA
jgi:radical SAM superfamily enzyme YgiQ (UPF0313 family)